MKKIFYLCALLLLHASGAFAQSTTVSGTITDSGGQTWGYGSVQFAFRPAASNPTAQYFWNGSPFSSSTTLPANPQLLSSSGSFSGLSIPSNTAISPAGSQWAVTVCAAASIPNCFTQLLTISGGTQNISSQVVPPPAIVNLTVPLLGAKAYTDAEVVGAASGTLFFNITQNALKVCPVAGYPPCQWEVVNPFPIIIVPGTLPSNAMALACAQGGGTVLVANGTYAGPPGTSWCNNLILQAINPNQPDICLEALGSHANCPSAGTTTPNVVFTYTNSLTIADVSGIGIHGITLDFGSSAGGNLTMAGVSLGNYDMTVNNCVVTAPCAIFGGTTNNNGYGNKFGYLGLFGGSEAIRVQLGGGHEWTVNDYDVVHIGAATQPAGTFTAMDFNAGCDTQHFNTVGFWAGAGVTAANGVIFNSASTTADEDANSIVIEYFFTTAVNFASGTGVTFNPSSGNYIKTGVMNWGTPVTGAGLPACPASGSVACVATGGPANSPNGTLITLDATAARTSQQFSGVKLVPVIPTVVLKIGSGNGTPYTTTTTSPFQVVDGTNLVYVVTIPVGMKVIVSASGACGQNTAIDTNGAKIALLDSSTVLAQTELTATAAGASTAFSLQTVVNGDGASHTLQLGFATGNAAHSVFINNAGTGFNPYMTFDLTASN